MASGTKRLFETSQGDGPVECLGKTFPNDQARREYFLERLREKLRDPAFRKIEGLPIGADEDIRALSDPPYYMACPNPFVRDYLEHVTKRRKAEVPYNRLPYPAALEDSRNNTFINAHS